MLKFKNNNQFYITRNGIICCKCSDSKCNKDDPCGSGCECCNKNGNKQPCCDCVDTCNYDDLNRGKDECSYGCPCCKKKDRIKLANKVEVNISNSEITCLFKNKSNKIVTKLVLDRKNPYTAKNNCESIKNKIISNNGLVMCSTKNNKFIGTIKICKSS